VAEHGLADDGGDVDGLDTIVMEVLVGTARRIDRPVHLDEEAGEHIDARLVEDGDEGIASFGHVIAPGVQGAGRSDGVIIQSVGAFCKHKKNTFSGVCNKFLVSPRGFRWNTLICKLESLDKKLEKLGIVEIDGQMVYLTGEEVQNV